MIPLGQQGHLHTKTVELEKVKRNRAALDIKSRFVFIYLFFIYLFISLISILDLFSAPPDESLLFSLLRIKFPSI